MSTPYESSQLAAQAALAEAMKSGNSEYAGVIYKRGGKFYYTAPKTSGDKKHVRVQVQYPKGSELIGLYHSHPPGENSKYFSPDDIHVSKELGLPYYMGDVSSGDMRVFHPKDKVSSRMIREGRSRRRVTYSEGMPLTTDEAPKPATTPATPARVNLFPHGMQKPTPGVPGSTPAAPRGTSGTSSAMRTVHRPNLFPYGAEKPKPGLPQGESQ